MSIQEFIEKVKGAVEERIGRDVHVYPVMKNNDTIYTGLVITDPVHNISPTIYIEPYYHRYIDGVSMEEIVEEIVKNYDENSPSKDFDVSIFKDFEKAKHRITMKVVNAKRNKKVLEIVPHIPFCDLSIIFMVDVSQAIQEYATILIYNHHLSFWDVTVEELYELAKENTPRQLQPRLDDLHDVFEFITGESLEFLENLNIKILTNHLHIHGATCIAYPELLKELYDIFEDNVVIIPSSIHEVLVFPESKLPDGYGLEYLNDMLNCVNQTELANHEILSDNVYLFNGTELEIIG